MPKSLEGEETSNYSGRTEICTRRKTRLREVVDRRLKNPDEVEPRRLSTTRRKFGLLRECGDEKSQTVHSIEQEFERAVKELVRASLKFVELRIRSIDLMQ